MSSPYRSYSQEMNYAERITLAQAPVLTTGPVARALHVSDTTAAKVIDANHCKVTPKRQLTRSQLLEFMRESGMDVRSVLPATLIIDTHAKEGIEVIHGTLRIQCTSLFAAGMYMADHAVTNIVIPNPTLYNTFAPHIRATCHRHAYPMPAIHTATVGSYGEGRVDASA